MLNVSIVANLSYALTYGATLTIEHLLGDCQGFFAGQRTRLLEIGIDIAGCPLSHLAFRTGDYRDYLRIRDSLESCCDANIENVWNGRPISKMRLASPLQLGDGYCVSLLELIPPPHRSQYRMGLEHTGVVLGNAIEAFAQEHRSELTGQQFQSEVCEPYYVRFADQTSVKFYRYSLMDVLLREGREFDGFHHVDDWSCEQASA